MRYEQLVVHDPAGFAVLQQQPFSLQKLMRD
jgi:hypothetical protein